jgi:hypothetical protein
MFQKKVNSQQGNHGKRKGWSRVHVATPDITPDMTPIPLTFPSDGVNLGYCPISIYVSVANLEDMLYCALSSDQQTCALSGFVLQEVLSDISSTGTWLYVSESKAKPQTRHCCTTVTN